MEKIQIKCSSCGQKFAVSESYRNKIVECGACDHRFKVEGVALVRQKKKYYPGERSQVNSDSFAKVESSDIPAQAVANNELGFQPAQAQKNVAPGYAQPASAKRTFLILSGAGLMILCIIVFVVGSRPDGILQDMDGQKRTILAIFIALLGSCLIIAGSWSKIKGMIVSLVLGGTLASLPFIIPVVLTPENIEGTDLSNDIPVPKEASEIKRNKEKRIEDYKNDIGYRKIESTRKKANDPSKVKALVVRDIKSHTDTILNYLKEELSLDLLPTTYTSGRSLDNRRVTLIIIEADITTEELIEITKKFGVPAKMDEMRTELDVVEVLVEQSKLKTTSSDILSDEQNAEFFNANYAELYHISRDRRITAIQRLEKATTSLGRRADIADRLSKMIDVKKPQVSNEAIRALKKWAIPEYNLDIKVKTYAEALADQGNLEIPVMEYLVEKNVQGISDILSKQWLNSNGHLVWDSLIQKAGSEGETAIIKALPTADSAHLKAASAVLRRIGTERSLPALNTALERAGKEDAKYLKATIDEIKSQR